MVAATNNTRGDDINTYNSAIATWTSQGYSAFNGASNFTLTSGTGTVALGSTNAVTNSPAVETGSDINSYTQFAAKVATNGVSGPVSPGAQLTLLSGTTPISLRTPPAGTQFTVSISSSCSQNNNCATVCANAGGSYSYSTLQCTAWAYVSSVCVVLAAPAFTSVDMSGSSTGGCARLPSSSSASIPSSFYSALGIGGDSLSPYGYSISATGPSSTAYVPITLRSAQDPWVVAMRITSGYPSSFGLTTGSKVGLGIGLLAIGGLFILGVIGAGVALYRGACRNSQNGGAVVECESKGPFESHLLLRGGWLSTPLMLNMFAPCPNPPVQIPNPPRALTSRPWATRHSPSPIRRPNRWATHQRHTRPSTLPLSSSTRSNPMRSNPTRSPTAPPPPPAPTAPLATRRASKFGTNLRLPRSNLFFTVSVTTRTLSAGFCARPRTARLAHPHRRLMQLPLKAV